jgi:L-seryl-tRNA(Ser) seleniumtransferase
VDSNHRPPGPEPGALARLSHAPITATDAKTSIASHGPGLKLRRRPRTIEFVTDTEKLRALPSVHEILERLGDSVAQYPRALVVAETRAAVDRARTEILSGHANPLDLETRVRDSLAQLEAPQLRRVINATGVVLHTNLGRAPLPAMDPPRGYSNLEYDLDGGRRGRRDTHTAALIERLVGAPGIAVNNNAAAVFLALHELAAGGEVLISRGELIEIGDGFRIPDIMARSGAAIREVGTTNRTRIEDYRAAIGDRTRLLFRVHPSNFRMSGFTARPELTELAALGRECGLPVYEDLGSGCVADLSAFGIDEPLVSGSLKAGADLVSFSGDKLLGGPQAGILAGKADLVQRLRRNPLFRALRLDKMIYQALETTLRHLLLEHWDAVPALAMIRQPAAVIRERARALLARLPQLRAEIVEATSVIGGGATPQQAIPTYVIAIACDNVVDCERKLRHARTPVIARIEDGRLLLDLRTVFAEEEPELQAALQSAI